MKNNTKFLILLALLAFACKKDDQKLNPYKKEISRMSKTRDDLQRSVHHFQYNSDRLISNFDEWVYYNIAQNDSIFSNSAVFEYNNKNQVVKRTESTIGDIDYIFSYTYKDDKLVSFLEEIPYSGLKYLFVYTENTKDKTNEWIRYKGEKAVDSQVYIIYKRTYIDNYPVKLEEFFLNEDGKRVLISSSTIEKSKVKNPLYHTGFYQLWDAQYDLKFCISKVTKSYFADPNQKTDVVLSAVFPKNKGFLHKSSIDIEGRVSGDVHEDLLISY